MSFGNEEFYSQIKQKLTELRKIRSDVIRKIFNNHLLMKDEAFFVEFAKLMMPIKNNLQGNNATNFFIRATETLSLDKITFVPREQEVFKPLVTVEAGGEIFGYLISKGMVDQEQDSEIISTVAEYILLLALYLKSSKDIEDNFSYFEVLNNITLVVNSSLNLDEVYQGFVEEIKKIVSFDRVSLTVVEDNKSLLILGINDITTKLGKGVVIPIEGTAPGWVVKNERSHIVHDLQSGVSFWEESFLVEEGIRSAIRIPLWVKGKIIGTLNFNSKIPNFYGKQEQILLEQVGRQVATAIQNAQLFKETEQQRIQIEEQNLRLQAFNKIAEVVGNSLNLEKTINKALNRVCEVLGTEAGAIFLLDEEGGQLRLKVHRGISADCVSAMDGNLLNESMVVTKVVKTGEPVVLFDGNHDKAGCLFSDKMKFQALSYIPLKARNKVLGVMTVGTNHITGSPGRDWELLVGIGSQIGIAIENAWLYEKIKHVAEYDGLTEVYNRRVFYKLLEKELIRARRCGSIFSVLMLDVDLFKEYNDQYGHLAGDEVLREMANIFKSNVREIDVVARYGGEEFVILAVESTKQQAYEVAERIRKVAESIGIKKAFPTISTGIASYPEDGTDVEELLRNADSALYVAKRKRNLCVNYDFGLFEEEVGTK